MPHYGADLIDTPERELGQPRQQDACQHADDACHARETESGNQGDFNKQQHQTDPEQDQLFPVGQMHDEMTAEKQGQGHQRQRAT